MQTDVLIDTFKSMWFTVLVSALLALPAFGQTADTPADANQRIKQLEAQVRALQAQVTMWRQELADTRAEAKSGGSDHAGVQDQPEKENPATARNEQTAASGKEKPNRRQRVKKLTLAPSLPLVGTIRSVHIRKPEPLKNPGPHLFAACQSR